MKKLVISKWSGIGLPLLAGLFLSSSALAKPVIVTLVTINGCKASYENNNCGGTGNTGDICIAKGPDTKVDLKYILAGGGANAGFTKMEIRRVSGKPCPDWVADDFPDFDPADCTYIPVGVPKTLQVSDENHHEAKWQYAITVELDDENCEEPVVVDPLIENGGNN